MEEATRDAATDQRAPGRPRRQSYPPRVSTAAVISTVLTIPILILEGARTIQAGEANLVSMRVVALLWLLLGIAIALGWSIARRFRGEEAGEGPLALPGRAALLILAGGAWLGIMADRLQCFLGLSSCS